MSDRIFGLIIAVVALAFFASATQLEKPFFAEPVGPKLFPYLISGAAFLAAISIIYSPDVEPAWPRFTMLTRLGMAVVVLILYAYLLKPLGFILPTILASSILSYQIKPRAIKSFITGISLSIILFVIFKYGLGLGLFAFPKFLWS